MNYNLEKIWWWDPTGYNEWQDQDAIEKIEPARCVTIAQVIHENKKWIVTAASWSNVEGTPTAWADVTVIPKGCIEKREKLKYAKTK